MKIRFKKLRLWLAYPFFIVYPFLVRPTNFSFSLGVAVMALGMVLRFWASGHISKSTLLATSGPYAYTRNPLYLGNFIIGLGIGIISAHRGLLAYYIFVFSILYLGTIQEEQKNLEKKFGEAYQSYLACVPAFFPSLRAYQKAEKKKFDIRLSFKNGEFIRLSGFSLLILFFYLWRSFVLQKDHLQKANTAVIFVFVVFLFLLWFNIFIRRKSEEKR